MFGGSTRPNLKLFGMENNMENYDLFMAFFLFFVLGALISTLLHSWADWRKHKQQLNDARLDRIENALRELRYGQIDNG